MQGSSAALLLQTGIVEMISHGSVFSYAVLAILACFSILSLAIALAKWAAFSSGARSDARFARAFRKANSLETVAAAAENFRPAPLVRVFDAGYAEVARQLNAHQRLVNKESISRSLQIAVSEPICHVSSII